MPNQQYYNRLFSLYAPAYHIVSRIFNKSRKNQVKTLRDLANKDKNILLVGGGDGIDIPLFKSSQQITYLDFSKGMYLKAKRKFKNFSNVTFIFHDALTFYPDKLYDIVCLHFCLSTTARPKEVVQRASSLLKPGGLLSIMDVSKPVYNLWGRKSNFIWARLVSDFNLDVLKISKDIGCNLIYKQQLLETKIYSSFILRKTI